MPLSDLVVRNLKPGLKAYKRWDEKGLYIDVRPNGSRYWRLRYRLDGRERLFALGVYPKVTLAKARSLRDEAYALIERGRDPLTERQATQRASRASKARTFEAVALECIEQRGARWDARYRERQLSRLQQNIFSSLGALAIAEIEAPEVRAALRKIEARDATQMALRTRQLCSQVFRYGIAAGYCKSDPASFITGAMKPHVGHHMAAVSVEEFPQLLRDMDECRETQPRLGLQLVALTFLRSNELLRAEWPEIDVEKAVWTVPATRMKMRSPHLVPLARQSLDILEQLRALNGDFRYVFAGINPGRPMNGKTLLNALHRLGYHKRQTVHGFRSIASTVMNEARKPGGERTFYPDVIERQLAHCERNAVRRAYNRAEYWPERVTMMQWWADHLDELRKTDD
jgi:integrase